MGLGIHAATVEHLPNFCDGCPVFARHSGNYKPASFGFCAQRCCLQPELRGDHAKALRRVVIDGDARKWRVILHSAAY
jgi:hypothetical protein